MNNPRPNFFILGAPKCGTTSTAAWLATHPQIFMSAQKEPQFFCNDLDPQLHRNLAEYEKLFSSAGPQHRAIGEASTWYLYSQAAVPNILEYAPDARFMVMLRNPCDMAPSLHEQLLVAGSEHISDFGQAWSLQAERQAGRHISRLCLEPQLLQYSAFCKLGEQLERLYAQVPRVRVLVLLMDDLRQNPRAEYLKILRFLGVNDDGRQEFPVRNAAKERRSPAYGRVIATLQKLRRRLPLPRLGLGLIGKLDRGNLRPRARQPLAAGIRRELQAHFREDIQRLAQLIGRDLSAWLQ